MAVVDGDEEEEDDDDEKHQLAAGHVRYKGATYRGRLSSELVAKT
jgi:hypothetical protein